MPDEKRPAVVVPESAQTRSCSRRRFVQGAALAACAPALGGLAGCARRISPNRDVDVGPPVDGKLLIPLSLAGELGRPGGAVVVRNPCIAATLVANTGSGIVAIAALCPHASCELAWVEEDRQAECPCHGSRFAGDGTLLSGPATSDVASYPATVDPSGAIVVNTLAGDNVFPAVSNGDVVIDLSDPKYHALQSPGGAVVGQPAGARSPIALTRPLNPPADAKNGIVVLSALCTHLTCTVLSTGGQLRCPCHGSVFDLDGGVLNGPAQSPLMPVDFDASPQGAAPGTGTVTVHLGPTC